MAKDEVGPPTVGPAKLIVPAEIRPARAAISGSRNGMPEFKPYVFGQSSGALARARRAERTLAHIRAQLMLEEDNERE